MPEARRQLVAVICILSVMVACLCGGAFLLWRYVNIPETVAIPAAVPTTQTAAPSFDLGKINKKINHVREWTIWKGKWTEMRPGLRGQGESWAEFGPDLPGRVRISFSMNVLEGMRPRIFLQGGPGFYVGNEGFEKQIFVFGPGLRELHGQPVAYENGKVMQVTIIVYDGIFQVLIDHHVITGKCSSCDRVRLRLEGGDSWSQGATEFGNLRVQAIEENGRDSDALSF
jgi:hypothetical protein